MLEQYLLAPAYYIEISISPHQDGYSIDTPCNIRAEGMPSQEIFNKKHPKKSWFDRTARKLIEPGPPVDVQRGIDNIRTQAQKQKEKIPSKAEADAMVSLGMYGQRVVQDAHRHNYRHRKALLAPRHHLLMIIL
jgi:hypothetical protein